MPGSRVESLCVRLPMNLFLLPLMAAVPLWSGVVSLIDSLVLSSFLRME